MFRRQRPVEHHAVCARRRSITCGARFRYEGGGGSYLLVVPGAVGRPKAYDDVEFDRSAETLAIHGRLVCRIWVKAAIEPIRAAEVSFTQYSGRGEALHTRGEPFQDDTYAMFTTCSRKRATLVKPL